MAQVPLDAVIHVPLTVACKVSWVLEAAVTLWARVWSLVSVGPPVNVQGAFLTKAFVADFADEWPLPTMHQFMPSDVCLGVAGVRAEGACKPSPGLLRTAEW